MVLQQNLLYECSLLYLGMLTILFGFIYILTDFIFYSMLNICYKFILLRKETILYESKNISSY